MSDGKKFLFASIGIFACYLYYGTLLEKITSARYGQDIQGDGVKGEQFTYTQALVEAQCVSNWICAQAILLFKSQPRDGTPMGYNAGCSLAYLLAMIGSTMALRWVAYPMQVIAKSSKPIPVMLLGVLIGRRRYMLQKYFFVLVIVSGVVLFMFHNGKSTADKPLEREGLGQLLLIGSLVMDGVLGGIQELIRAHSSPTALQIMAAMNGWSAVMLLPVVVLTGEAKDFVIFVSKYPEGIGDLLLLALTGALGQLFIFMMVSSFGALACSVVTTTRKFFTILLSVVLFGHELSRWQWLGAVLVFVGLFADMFFGENKIGGNENEGRTELSGMSHEVFELKRPKSNIARNVIIHGVTDISWIAPDLAAYPTGQHPWYIIIHDQHILTYSLLLSNAAGRRFIHLLRLCAKFPHLCSLRLVKSVVTRLVIRSVVPSSRLRPEGILKKKILLGRTYAAILKRRLSHETPCCRRKSIPKCT